MMGSERGRRFAVIIDETHRSHSGESAKNLKKIFSAGIEEAENLLTVIGPRSREARRERRPPAAALSSEIY